MRSAGLDVLDRLFEPVLQRGKHLRAEIRGNARLRIGLYIIAATFWVWLLLLAQEQAKQWRVDAAESVAETERLKPLQNATPWLQRYEEARRHLEAAKAMQWSAASQGLAEAALQDTLRTWSEKAGLPVRELAVSAGPASAAGDILPLRARLVVDMERIGLMGLLAELGRSPKVMVVENLRLRPAANPARAELEIKVLFRAAERKP